MRLDGWRNPSMLMSLLRSTPEKGREETPCPEPFMCAPKSAAGSTGAECGLRSRSLATMGRRAVAFALTAAAVFFLLRGCALMPWNRERTSREVRITVSADFGSRVHKDTWTRVEGNATAMRALERVAEVETAYGGGFIQGIDGVRSRYDAVTVGGEKVDWFFYVNGHLADVGAGEYLVNEGDWLVFDYHPWDYSMFTTFLAGCYVEAFRFGYGGERPDHVVVVGTPGDEEEAAEVARILEEEVGRCERASLDRDWSPRTGEYTVVVGVWEEMENNTYLRDSQVNARKAGLLAFFEEGALKVMDGRGGLAGSFSRSAGVVLATGPRLGDGRSVLLVAGCDERGLREAIMSLTEGRPLVGSPVPAWVALEGEGSLPVPMEAR